jgi:beta-mannosidase
MQNGFRACGHKRVCFSVTSERYRAWLQLLKDGNQNMVRVWGGGIYEHDVFYDICDGLFCSSCHVFPSHSTVFLQSWVFSFGKTLCSVVVRSVNSFSTRAVTSTVLREVKYPAYDAFVANVKLEAVQNVQRLRHHPSIVILAGNNEGLAPFSEPQYRWHLI